MHDTFFLDAPASTLRIPDKYCARVQAVHESGGYGSIGYRVPWKRSEAEKNVLRTHTTAVSSRMLQALACTPGGFRPAKYFSIDRVFRNGTCLGLSCVRGAGRAAGCARRPLHPRLCRASSPPPRSPRPMTFAEALDATHLAEFHQVEGVVADYNLGLGDLIGIITEFFRRIGITQLRFKPAFNPYTEPSMEVFGYHPDLGKWTEIGNR